MRNKNNIYVSGISAIYLYIVDDSSCLNTIVTLILQFQISILPSIICTSEDYERRKVF